MNATERTQQLFEAHGAFVFRIVRRLGAPAKDVEDLTQEVFIVAHRKSDSFDGASPRGWLFRIATRVVADYRRRASRRLERLDTTPPEQRTPSSAGQEALVWDGQLREALDDALELLSDDERAIFVLYELEELPMRECATIAACPEQTGYSRLKAARRKMRAALETRADLMRSLGMREVV